MMHLMLCVQILQVYDAQIKHSDAGQIRPSADKVVVAACENCRLQIGDLNAHYNLNVEITALADLVVKAMRLPNAAAPDESISVKSRTGRHRGTRLESGLAQAVECGLARG
jgi:hypothetical protein